MNRRRKIRLIHTSDTHLGDGWDPGAAERALSAVVDGVRALSADALLIAGDVFDNARISDDLLDFFVGEMGRAEVPAIILPGNHDLYDAGSLYRRAPFDNVPSNLHIIRGTRGETITFESLTLDVWGRAMDNHTPAFRPLAGMRVRYGRPLAGGDRPRAFPLSRRYRGTIVAHLRAAGCRSALRLSGPGTLGAV